MGPSMSRIDSLASMQQWVPAAMLVGVDFARMRSRLIHHVQYSTYRRYKAHVCHAEAAHGLGQIFPISQRGVTTGCTCLQATPLRVLYMLQMYT